MSVVVGKRKESKYEFVYKATLLNDAITDLCIRRLGIKDIDHLMREKFSYKGSRFYDRDDQISMIQESKRTLMQYTDGILSRTRIAYAMQSDSLEHCDIQIKLIEEAEMYCELIIGKLQSIIGIFQVDINVYKPYVKAVDEEIYQLRKRKKKLKRIRQKFIRGDF